MRRWAVTVEELIDLRKRDRTRTRENRLLSCYRARGYAPISKIPECVARVSTTIVWVTERLISHQSTRFNECRLPSAPRTRCVAVIRMIYIYLKVPGARFKKKIQKVVI